MFQKEGNKVNGEDSENIPLQNSRHSSNTCLEIPDGQDEQEGEQEEVKKALLLWRPMRIVNDALDCVENGVSRFFREHKAFKYIWYLILLLAYLAYVVVACVIDLERAKTLLVLSVIGCLCLIYSLVKHYYGDIIASTLAAPFKTQLFQRFKGIMKWCCVAAFVVFVVVWIVLDVGAHKQRLMSLLGLMVYLIIGFLFSNNRRRVNWRPVLWGLALQFIAGLFILRWKIGFQIFNWIGQRFQILLGFSKVGSEFFFRDLPQLAFVIFPIVAYFSALMYLLWYFGVTSVIVDKLGWLFQITLGTTPAESVCAAGNIFLGMVISPLLIRQYLHRMTESEIHCLMTGGFATIAGSALGTYIYMFGISPSHLISASVMSAPAALAISKLMCPETKEKDQLTDAKEDNAVVIEKPKEQNVFEAAAVGATMSTSLIANIFVCLTAFLSIKELINALLKWFGSMVGEPCLSFELVSSYVFMPFAYVMGVPWSDAFTVAELFGVKMFFNEFLAYARLSAKVKMRDAGLPIPLSKRSEVITTYALCAFANVGSMGFTVGGLSALVPAKRRVFAKHVLRAMIAGTLATFMTACIAGLLYDDADDIVVAQNMFLNATRPMRPMFSNGTKCPY